MTVEQSVNAAMFPIVSKLTPLPRNFCADLIRSFELMFWCNYISSASNMQQLSNIFSIFTFLKLKKPEQTIVELLILYSNLPRLSGGLLPLCSCSFPINLRIFLLVLYKQAFYHNPIELIFCRHHIY